MPWANGKGVTRELLREPEGEAAFSLRLSVADVVEPGPFSPLPGIDRQLTLIEGAGFDLTINGKMTPVERYRPVAFSGDDAVAAIRVAGPSRDFNVMAARGRLTVDVRVATDRVEAGGAGRTLVYIAEGAFRAGLEAAADEVFVAGDLLEATGEAVTLAGEGVALIIACS